MRKVSLSDTFRKRIQQFLDEARHLPIACLTIPEMRLSLATKPPLPRILPTGAPNEYRVRWLFKSQTRQYLPRGLRPELKMLLD